MAQGPPRLQCKGWAALASRGLVGEEPASKLRLLAVFCLSGTGPRACRPAGCSLGLPSAPRGCSKFLAT